MPTGYAPYNPSPRVAQIVDVINHLLANDLAETLPVTARQIFYRLVALGVIGKDADKSFYEYLTRARRAQMVPFADIIDSGITAQHVNADGGPGEVIATAKAILQGQGYQLDRQAGQARRVLIWTETAGMVPQIARVAAPYGVDVVSGGGQPSITFCWQLAQQMDQHTLILQIGDWDQGGRIIERSAGDDIAAFAAHDRGVHVEVRRIAVTPEQAYDLDLPGQVAKFDSRWKDWAGPTWQAEAIDPVTLADMVRDAILGEMDMTALKAVLDQEDADKDRLKKQAVKITDRGAGRPSSHDDSVKAQAIRAAQNGLTIRQISEALDVPRSTVARWVKGAV